MQGLGQSYAFDLVQTGWRFAIDGTIKCQVDELPNVFKLICIKMINFGL